MNEGADRDELCARIRAAVEVVPSIDVTYLFGSRAAGRARPDSDVDVAIHFAHGTTPEQRDRARHAIVAALGDRVDLVDLDRASSTLGFRVIRDGVRAFERSARARVCLEARIARRYDDDEPYRRLFRDAAVRAGQRMERRADGRS